MSRISDFDSPYEETGPREKNNSPLLSCLIKIQEYFQRKTFQLALIPVTHSGSLSIKVSSEMHKIFYLNTQHPFAPYNWLAHISCCLLWSITSDKSDKATAPSQRSVSCASLNTRSDGMSLSANLSLENQASQLWHMLKQQQRCDYGVEERCQLLNDPSLIYW